jgi:hypothetical protein
MKMHRVPAIALLAVLAGCVGMNDAMTPSAKTSVDEFDGATIVRQAPVSAATGLSEDRHLLGFEWNQKFPDTVFITCGSAFGIRAIEGVSFNADGKVFEHLKPASTLTEFRNNGSLRRFQISLADFRTIAGASVVKMRLEGVDAYTVSTFGPGAGSGMAFINTKFAPFLDQVQQALKR